MEKIIILNEKENPIFKRKEVEVKIELNISPKMQEAEELIAKKFSATAENIKIKKIKGKFGSSNFIITANIYSSREEKEKTEPKSKKETKPEIKKE